MTSLHEVSQQKAAASERYGAGQSANRMRSAAFAFLESLGPAERARAMFDFSNDAERLDWDFIPKFGRHGLPMKDMTYRQQQLAQLLLASGLSISGYIKAVQIMNFENVLRELNKERAGLVVTETRTPGNYFFSFFGEPQQGQVWGWRLVGHHVTLNYTIVDGCVLPTPTLFGAEPASIGSFSPLKEDEDLGFALLYSLSAEQRQRTIIHDVAPPDLVSRVVPGIGEVEMPERHLLGIRSYEISDHDRELLKYVRSEAKGLPGSAMDEEQRVKFTALIKCYCERLPQDIAASALGRVQQDGLASFAFAWAGKPEYGKPHYYRIQGPSFLVEFDNATTGGDQPQEANHIHAVWRDPDNDFGGDVLMRHYEEAHLNPPMAVTRLRSTVERGAGD